MSEEVLLASDIVEIVEGLGETSKNFEGKTILITGCRGFLGRYFTETLFYLNEHVFSKPCKIIGIDNMITAGKFGHTKVENKNYRFIEHNIIKPYQADTSFDYILHAAGIASPYYYRAHPLETLEVAISGTRNVLELAKSSKARILFFSSSEIYGDPDPKYVPTPESYRGNVACLGPRACYDESKRVGETLCQIFHQQYGTHTNMVRPFNIYGPGMQEKDYRVLPNFASRIKGKLPLNIYGSGNQTRTFCYIVDGIIGFLKVLAHGVPGEPYNIGNPKPEISMVELAKISESVLKKELKINIVQYPDSYPADEPNRRCPDIKKAQLQLGFSPRVSLEEGLRRFYSWSDRVFIGEQ